MPLLSFLLFAAGLLVLVKGANWLVHGSSSLALKLKLSPIVIGLTVVAFGTSSPELVVSLTSAVSGNTSIALGNVVGSNIANILLILGISAILAPLKVKKNTIWKEIPMSFLAAIILTILGLQNLFDTFEIFRLDLGATNQVGEITFSNGLVLLSFFIIFLYYTFGIAKVSADEPEVEEKSLWYSIFLIVVGLMALGLGSKLAVDNAIVLARLFGVSDIFIGLTIVAIGTSLPELVTSIVAAIKKQSDVVMGNIIGSNIFNIFFILGSTALVKNVPLTGQNVVDILVLLLTTIFLFISMFVLKSRQLNKIEGALMISAYLLYLYFLIVRG